MIFLSRQLRSAIVMCCSATLLLTQNISIALSQDSNPQNGVELNVHRAPLVIPTDKKPEVSPQGKYTQRVAINAPQFYSIKPSVSLQYTSTQRQNSDASAVLGLGWSLHAGSVIKRTNIGGGVPFFEDFKDIYQLDGIQLLACADNNASNIWSGSYPDHWKTKKTSASCSSGGNFAAQSDNYFKIERKINNNTWEVLSTAGIKRQYRPVSYFKDVSEENSEEAQKLLNVSTWLLNEEMDTLGNKIKYSWTIDQQTEGYAHRLALISYGPYQIKFNYGQRSDVISFATGTSIFGEQHHKLTSIEIKEEGNKLRAYSLDYSSSDLTRKSLLMKVEEFGSDYKIANNRVNSGTKLPALYFEYEPEVISFKDKSFNTQANGVDYWQRFFPVNGADFNRDGKDEIFWSGYVRGEDDNEGGDGLSNDNAARILVLDNEQASISSNILFKDDNPPLSYNYDHKYLGLLPKSLTNERVAVVYFDDNFRDGELLISKFDDDSYKHVSLLQTDATNAVMAQTHRSNSQVILTFNEKTKKIHSYEINESKAKLLSTSAGLIEDKFSRDDLDKFFDINGDGLDDFISVGATDYLYRNFEGNFDSMSSLGYIKVFGDDLYAKGFGDFNGDGLSDLAQDIDKKNISVLLSTGDNFLSPSVWTEQSKFEVPKTDPYYGNFFIELAGDAYRDLNKFIVIDVNNDGLSDLIQHNFMSGAKACSRYGFCDTHFPYASRIFISTGAQFVPLNDANTGKQLIIEDFAGFGDFNGDGLLDVVGRIDTSSERFRTISYGNGGFGNLLKRTTSAEGKITTINYTTSRKVKDNLQPFNTVLVSDITVDDGLSTLQTISFKYEGGRYNKYYNRSLGFGKIITILPKVSGESNAPTIETTYRQDLASVGKIAQRVWKDGDGTVLRKQVEEYTAQNDNAPFTSLNTASLIFTYDGGIEKVRKVVREFDAYGQLKHRVDHGDVAKSGDERTYTRWSYPNIDKYIVDRWAVEQVNEGTSYDYSDRRAMRRWNYYDNQNVDVAPTKGLTTQVSQWTGGGNEDKRVLEQNSYDSYGNLISRKNALGETTSYVYDAQDHLFPIEERSPLYHGGDTRHKVRTSWDKACGQPLTQTDANGKVTSYSYDVLCRLVRTEYPDGGYEALSYVNWGVPTSQHIVKTSTPTKGSTPVTSREYYDGLGRVWKTEQDVGAGQIVRELTGYNARGQKAWAKPLHAPGTEPQPVTYSYDALGRQTRMDYGDGSFMRTSYGAGPQFRFVEVTDALGNKARTHFDAYDNEVVREKLLDGQWLATRMDYDVLNQLVKVTDPAGSIWTYSFDGLGNQVSATDPNLGTWTKEYDGANRLIKQTDNKGQVTTFTYDKAGRTKSRQVVGQLLNQPPVLSQALTDQSLSEGSAWSYTVPAGSFSDPEGTILTFSASLSDGSALPAWLSFNGNTFTGTAPASSAGEVLIKVSASDGALSTADVFKLTITASDTQPEPIMGTSANETLKGTAAADEIHGLAGNDKLYGLAGNDKLYGGEGYDELYGGAG
ncbi:putative Ig domain-containing protein, partial [Pseudovibrio denitrificans]